MRIAGVTPAEKPAATRDVVGVGFECKTQNCDPLTRHGAKQPVHHQAGDAVLLPGVERHHLLPVGGHLVQAVVAAEIHNVEDVFLEAATTKAWTGLEELGSKARIGADGTGHLLHIGAGGFAEGGDARQGIGGEFAELAAPEVGAKDALGWHPLVEDSGERYRYVEACGYEAAESSLPISTLSACSRSSMPVPSARNSGLESTAKVRPSRFRRCAPGGRQGMGGHGAGAGLDPAQDHGLRSSQG